MVQPGSELPSLFRDLVPDLPLQPLPVPELRTMAGTSGALRFVGLPLAVDGRPLGYPSPPEPYGGSAPAWA